MASKTLRRRLHHGDVDGRKNEHLDISRLGSLSEPLLEKYGHDDSYSEGYGHENYQDLWDEQRREHLHWTSIFSQLIAQWAQWLANIIIGSGSLIGRLLPLSSIVQNGHNKNIPLSLSHLQEERLRILQQRLEVPFDGSRQDHQDALRQLWQLAYPDRELPSLKSELWKDMGWQGSDPSTDFRGGGFISLENLIFFAKKYPLATHLHQISFWTSLPSTADRSIALMDSSRHLNKESFQRLLHKQDGQRAEWEYPFAIAGINISFMLGQMLDLQAGSPTSPVGIRFLQLLGEDEMAFDNLYCVAFQLMDAQWLAKHASYMEFNEVLKSTRMQLERELALEDVSSIEDLPAYNMLN